jgi:molecular chaperone Hsp33
MNYNDQLQRFVFESLPIRGEFVRLDATWRAITEKQDYPPEVRDVLGEALVASALLSSTLKYDGSLTLQLQSSEGRLSMLVAECTSERTMRGLAKWSDDPARSDSPLLSGDGKLVITIDPANELKRYQSIVALEGDTLPAILGNYLSHSEQIATELWIVSNASFAAGLLLQKLPEHSDDPDAWNRAVQLTRTVEADELLSLPVMTLLQRLYHEEDIRVFAPEPVSFRCTCSRDRVGDMLRALGAAELRSIIQDEGIIDVNCEFCNHQYQFDSVDAEVLFSETPPPEHAPGTTH